MIGVRNFVGVAGRQKASPPTPDTTPIISLVGGDTEILSKSAIVAGRSAELCLAHLRAKHLGSSYSQRNRNSGQRAASGCSTRRIWYFGGIFSTSRRYFYYPPFTKSAVSTNTSRSYLHGLKRLLDKVRAGLEYAGKSTAKGNWTFYMSELFTVFKGRVLEVSLSTSNLLAEWFPNVDQAAEFRAIDSWLYSMPRKRWPKKHQRFLINWFRKVRVNYAENIQAELHVGTGPRG